MARTKDIVLILGASSREVFIGERTADWGAEVKVVARRLTLPWRGRVGSHVAKRNASRGGVISPRGTVRVERLSPHPTAHFIRGDPPPPGEDKKESYTDAVVTPPSTTMVWPVMKVEA